MKWQRHHKTYTYYITYRSQIWLNRTNITKNAWLISFKVPQHYICRVSYSLLPIRILDLSVWTSNEQDFVLPWHGNSPWPHQINTKLVAVHEIRTWNHSARNSASLSYQTGTREQHQGRPCPWWKLAAQLPRNPSWLQTGALTKQCDFRPSLTHDKTKKTRLFIVILSGQGLLCSKRIEYFPFSKGRCSSSKNLPINTRKSSGTSAFCPLLHKNFARLPKSWSTSSWLWPDRKQVRPQLPTIPDIAR